MKLQAVVAAMNQRDMSLYRKLNLHIDAIIANQCNYNAIEIENIDEHSVMLVSTTTLGVGKNRNIGMMYATGDILVFSDDDSFYYDNAEEIIIEAFKKKPKADAIIFGVEIIKNGSVIDVLPQKSERLHIYNSFRYGTYAICVKRNFLIRNNIHFNELFGGGCLYGSGEDSMFIRDIFKYRGRMYSCSSVIGYTCKDSSTWYTGHNKKYFYDRGAFVAAFCPCFKYLLICYYVIRMKKMSEISAKEMFKQMNAGAKGYFDLTEYDSQR